MKFDVDYRHHNNNCHNYHFGDDYRYDKYVGDADGFRKPFGDVEDDVEGEAGKDQVEEV